MAWWTPRPESPEVDVSAAELQAFLRASLPDYMVPAAFLRLAAFPLTPNGKVDRQALPSPEPAAAARRPPAGKRGRAGAWPRSGRRSSAQPGILLEDNFFSLGGDSIVVIQAITRYRNAGWVLKPRDFFTAASLAELAALARPVEAAAPAEPVRLRGIDVSGDLALSEEDLDSLLDSL